MPRRLPLARAIRARDGVSVLRILFSPIPRPSIADPDPGLSSADMLVVEAGGTVPAWMARGEPGGARGCPALYVRLGGLHTESAGFSLGAEMALRPGAVVLPGVRNGADLQHLCVKLSVVEAEAGLPDGATGILALIDSPAGTLGLASLAGATPRLAGIVWDAEALAEALGAGSAWDSDGLPVEPCRVARSLVLHAARAAGVPAFDTAAPLDTDPAVFAAACRAATRDGFDGKIARSAAQARLIRANAARAP